MATLPTKILEVEFDAGVWTDITADMVELSTRRGRNRESGAFETGTMSVTVRNDTRKYDPDHTTGPYYGKLRPNRRIRFRATWSAFTYPIWQGYIDSIAQVYGGPNDATAVIQASDLFKLLNRVELADSVYAAEVTADAPNFWFRLGEPSGSTTVADSQTGVTLAAFGAPALGATGLTVRDPDTALGQNDTTSGFAGTSVFYTPGTPTPVSLEAWVSTTTAVDSTIASVGDAGAGFGFRLYVSAGKAVFEVQRNIGAAVVGATAGGTVTINDGRPHHLVGVYTAGAFPNMALYVDGVAAGTGDQPVSTATYGAQQEFTVGNVTAAWAGLTGHGQGLVGTVDEVAFYRSALSTTRIGVHNTAGRTPWNGDLSGARLQRIATLAGLVSADLQIDAGSTTLQATNLGGTALSYAQKVEETELGRLFVSADGRLTFLSRYNADTLPSYTSPQATLTDADSGSGLGYTAVSADVDESRIVTRATVSREGSVAVTYGDTAAQTEFKIIDETHDGLLHDNDAYSLYYAQWIVNTHKTPGTWVGTVTLELASDPTNMYPGVFQLELAERVTYKRKPQNVGAVLTLPMRIEAIVHETGVGYWRTQLQLSPFYLTASGSLWILGTAGSSELGQTTTLGL